ncbi:hypothetical protein TWF730_010861 [Orbilia blumenaviensis]|uniref:Nucleoside phosphorylase domain-containing protein n=1 Tax=Orbilia blumenaviensis TaxID=1796055 RepID=A0AAV9UJS3_9PEZI
MEFEMSALRYMLDHEHTTLADSDEQQGDPNVYILGELGGLNVVLTYLPGSQGKAAAATAAQNLERTFQNIKYRFLIGIGGGVPGTQNDVRLGDVVVSKPQGNHAGIIQYDLGKDTEDGFTPKGYLQPPPPLLINIAEKMVSDHRVKSKGVEEFITAMVEKDETLGEYSRPSNRPDIAYKADYLHKPGETTCRMCGGGAANTLLRERRAFKGPKIHYGLIASGDRVIKSATKRDEIVKAVGDVLCFEMEAAGIATGLSYLVIRGISDYADTHKNDDWHFYAAATAAACAKEMIIILASKVSKPSASADTSLTPGQGPTISATNYGSGHQAFFQGTGFQNTGSGTISIGGSANFHGR